MKKLVVAAAVAFSALMAQAQGPYKVIRIAKVGGEGGFDYVNNDEASRKLYIARRATPPVVNVFNLDTLEMLGAVTDTGAHGAVVDPKSGHGFASSKPITMFDAKTNAVIKKIDVDGSPDGLLYDPFNARVWVLSHAAPNVTVIDAKDGSVVGTIDLGGAPEQGASDGKGTVYIDVEDKNTVAVVDAKTLKVKTTYALGGEANKTAAGLALDAKNGILFVACRTPASMVILDAKDGKILSTLPLGTGTDGAAFNPTTMEAFSSNGDGTLTVIKEKSKTEFEVEQTLTTMPGAKTMTLDAKTGRILLIAAEYGPVPPPANPPAAGGRGRGRGPLLPGSFSIIEVGK